MDFRRFFPVALALSVGCQMDNPRYDGADGGTDGDSAETKDTSPTGDGDGDTSSTAPGTGTSGDGDGDTSSTAPETGNSGDGDGDGDGDTGPNDTGDGDGDTDTGTSTSGDGDGDGDTGDTGIMECAISLDQADCGACLTDKCCEDAEACLADDDCSCMFDCLVLEGLGEPFCIDTCNPNNDALFGAIGPCVVMHCSQVCGPP